ncbi:AI-2E family transporter [Lentzea sp.]|uniref:AI-2E family transporter n=1 Tax=Lentzea sp. TaxID=56099 RepID=UPI002ED1A5DF
MTPDPGVGDRHGGTAVVSIEREHPSSTRSPIPPVLHTGAALGWRFLVVVASLYVIGVILGRLASLVVPLAIALLLAALLTPAVGFLVPKRIPRVVATLAVLVGGLVVLGGLLTFVVTTFVNGVPDLAAQLVRSVDTVSGWLVSGPLHLSETHLSEFSDRAVKTLQDNQSGITSGALTTAATVIVIAVNQLESHVLQPFLLGRAVKLHPLSVVLAIASGLLVAGIAGALLAVPLLAVLNPGIRSLLSDADEHVAPADVHTSEPGESAPDEPGLDTEAGTETRSR